MTPRTEIVTRLDVSLRADPARVLARLFVPGRELLADTESRASGVLDRILALSDTDVRSTLDDVLGRFGHRHRDLPAVLALHYGWIAHRVPGADTLSPERRTLIGAWFTNEYSLEAAALFNPSAVVHPDQTGLPRGHVRFVLSLRAVGEGHLSSIEFRTGVFDGDATVVIDDPGPHVEVGKVIPAAQDRDLFAAMLAEEGADAESMSFLISRLPPRFGELDLEGAAAALVRQRVTRHGGTRTVELARQIAYCTYGIEFPADARLGGRVLWPHGPTETHGMEDARFVRFVDDDGSVTYRATYTAFDGSRIAPQTIETVDFCTFRISRFAGPTARDKGFALFPRTIGGRHFALSRWDRESNTVATSADGNRWDGSHALNLPDRVWSLIQSGNCGSPVETDSGWLVLTHGVGPMREYSLGALLLDRDDPTIVLGALREPLLRAREDERDGYVPNVVYSCGGLLHGDRMLLPYGASDASVRFAVLDVPLLLARLRADGPSAQPPVRPGRTASVAMSANSRA